ncbi:phage tail-collar fiber domain-containing protein [Bosea thiooxidans]
MTTGLLTTTVGRAAIIADLGGGADLVLTHVAWGDANGVPYNPNEAQVALVNEKYRATIASVAVVGGAIVVDAIIPADTNDGTGRPSHGFSVAEVGLFSSTGTLIGVARCGNGYKPPPSSGQAHDVTYRLKLAVANPSAITVVIDPIAQVNIARHVRPFWVTVDGVLNDPPAAPAVGATYIIGAVPTGAWIGFEHRMAQWIGVWALTNVPIGHQVVDQSKGRYAGNRWLERTATGWDAGLTRLVQRQPGNAVTAAGTANALTLALDPSPGSWADLVKVPLNVEINTTNSGPATVSVTGLAGTKPLINHDGTALSANDLLAFSIRRMIFDGNNMRVDPVLSWNLIDTRIKAFLANAKPSAVRVYNASATWTKPANLNFVRVRECGAGASGGMSSGTGGTLGQYWGGAGGNGGYVEAYIMAADLGATQAVTVGAGGAARLTSGGAQAGANGGGSQFSYLFAAGGLAGGGLAGAPGDYGDGGSFTLNPPAVGYGVQGVRGQPGVFFGIPMPAILGLYGRGGNGGSVGAGANGVGGSEGIVIIEEYLLP